MLENFEDTQTIKNRLRYILTKVPNNRANLNDIRNKYSELFPNFSEHSKDNIWESNIVKVLQHSLEFNTSDSKTKYRLKEL